MNERENVCLCICSFLISKLMNFVSGRYLGIKFVYFLFFNILLHIIHIFLSGMIFILEVYFFLNLDFLKMSTSLIGPLCHFFQKKSFQSTRANNTWVSIQFWHQIYISLDHFIWNTFITTEGMWKQLNRFQEGQKDKFWNIII